METESSYGGGVTKAATFTDAAGAGGENVLHADRQGTTGDEVGNGERNRGARSPCVRRRQGRVRHRREPDHGAAAVAACVFKDSYLSWEAKAPSRAVQNICFIKYKNVFLEKISGF